MQIDNPGHDSLTEQQAAERLGITIDALHRLLDQYIFNNGTVRPSELFFTHSDLILLSYWSEKPSQSKVLPMPRRRQ